MPIDIVLGLAGLCLGSLLLVIVVEVVRGK